jgi:hypothetical protein
MKIQPANLAVIAAVAGKMRPGKSLRDILVNTFGLTDASLLFKPDASIKRANFPPLEWFDSWSTQEERVEWMKTGRWLSYQTGAVCA